MTDVLLVTCAQLPDGEPGAEALDAVLAARGLSARWVLWDDDSVDWASARLVAVRSTWDYTERLEDFLAWARRVETETTLLNGAAVFAWNTDKAYLVELAAAGVPVVPTVAVDHRDELVAAAASFESRVVVKPRVGAGGFGLSVFDDPDDADQAEGDGPWAVQPVVETVRTSGEGAVFVIDGETTYAVRKLPAADELRVHEQFGGKTTPTPLDEEAARLAKQCVRTTEGLLSTTLHYARVDTMEHQGQLVVSELEITEPGLYLDVLPQNAEPFADLITRLLK